MENRANKKKPVYEKPRSFSLSGVAQGACETGLTFAASGCTAGSSAGYRCGSGALADSRCSTGETAGTNCGAGGSAGTYCGAGGNPYS